MNKNIWRKYKILWMNVGVSKKTEKPIKPRKLEKK